MSTIDRNTHRAYAEAAIAPLDSYVAEYRETPPPVQAAHAAQRHKLEERINNASWHLRGESFENFEAEVSRILFNYGF